MTAELSAWSLDNGIKDAHEKLTRAAKNKKYPEDYRQAAQKMADRLPVIWEKVGAALKDPAIASDVNTLLMILGAAAAHDVGGNTPRELHVGKKKIAAGRNLVADKVADADERRPKILAIVQEVIADYQLKGVRLTKTTLQAEALIRCRKLRIPCPERQLEEDLKGWRSANKINY